MLVPTCPVLIAGGGGGGGGGGSGGGGGGPGNNSQRPDRHARNVNVGSSKRGALPCQRADLYWLMPDSPVMSCIWPPGFAPQHVRVPTSSLACAERRRLRRRGLPIRTKKEGEEVCQEAQTSLSGVIQNHAWKLSVHYMLRCISADAPSGSRAAARQLQLAWPCQYQPGCASWLCGGLCRWSSNDMLQPNLCYAECMHRSQVNTLNESVGASANVLEEEAEVTGLSQSTTC